MRILNRVIEKLSRSNPNYSCDDIMIEFRRISKENGLFAFMERVIGRLYQL